jgi:hypothetical protein
MIFHVKVVFKKYDFLLPFLFIIFHFFFLNFKKINYMKRVFSNFKNIYMKVVFCKEDFHTIKKKKKKRESCLL